MREVFIVLTGAYGNVGDGVIRRRIIGWVRDAGAVHAYVGNAPADWVEQLGEVDTSGVEPMTAVIANTLRLRDDVVDADPLTGGGKRDAILANAPAAEHGFFGVPKVIE